MPRLIQRPRQQTRVRTDPATVDALVQTAGTTQAVVIPIASGDTAYNTYNRYRNALRTRGYTFHGRWSARDELAGWVAED